MQATEIILAAADVLGFQLMHQDSSEELEQEPGWNKPTCRSISLKD